MRSGENAEDVSTGEAHTQKKQIRKKRAEGYREHKQHTDCGGRHIVRPEVRKS